MKNLASLLLLSFMTLFLVSCQPEDDNVDMDTYSVVYDLKNLNFAFNSVDGYHISRTFNNPLFSSDVVLIYRQNGLSNGNPIWQQIPKTIYFSNGDELDYDFDFTVNDIMIYAGGTFDLATAPEYITNQTFRVVIVPASFGKSTVDYSDYHAVIKHFKIDDSKVKVLK